MRVHNFGAGPCTLPLDILEEARQEFLDYAGTGMSVIEMSHRSPEYDELHGAAIAAARRLAAAPDDVEVAIIQGGATLQFAMVAMNLLGPDVSGGYAVTGTWGAKAMADAARHGHVYPAWDGAPEGFVRTPADGEIVLHPGTRYLHITTNETIAGIRYPEWPRVEVPLVADMSSEYLARPIPWDRVGLVYGGVQKNLGPAGAALVFIRRDMVESAPELPNYLSYRWHVDTGSLGNTPPMFTIYLMGKVLARLEAQGGVAALAAESQRKAGLIYGVIDGSDGFYRSPVDPAHRSWTNVVFRLPDEDLEGRFLDEAARAHLVGLRGHRSVGGCRASLYAGLPMESAERLAEFMEDFAARHRR